MLNKILVVAILGLIIGGVTIWNFVTPELVPNVSPPNGSPPDEPPPDETVNQTFLDWVPDGNISATASTFEYNRTLEFGDGQFVVYWRHDDEFCYMALKGETMGWIAIGFEPSVQMDEADMIFGWVSEGIVTMDDLYSTGPTGPHPTDISLGGTNDLLEYGGREENGVTILEFKRRLNTGDTYDHAFKQGQTLTIIWAIGDADNLTTKHSVTGYGQISFS
jgi:hypothetical protein